jgi:hypothetical protein
MPIEKERKSRIPCLKINLKNTIWSILSYLEISQKKLSILKVYSSVVNKNICMDNNFSATVYGTVDMICSCGLK